MRNDITPARFDLSSPALAVRHTLAKPRGPSPRERVGDERPRKGDDRTDPPGKTIPPASDFEGFGSFCR